MIYGIGIDIIEVKRIASAIENTGFCTRFFSERENEYFEKKKYKPETVAGNFAAKEAFAKALGTGISGFNLKDVEVLRNDRGMPYIELSTELRKRLNGAQVLVSISHEREYAVANVIIEAV